MRQGINTEKGEKNTPCVQYYATREIFVPSQNKICRNFNTIDHSQKNF